MDLLDILFDLLGLAIALIGKFWVLIAMGLSYLLFGKKREQRKSAPTIRRVLTPSADGGYHIPSSQKEPEPPVETLNPFSRSVEYVDPGSVVESSLSSGVVRESDDLHVKIEHDEYELGRNGDIDSSERMAINPREAMKWSLIFAPPRSKQPYRQQLIKK